MRFVRTAENLFGLPLGFTRVEYLESSGTQYIDTGFVPTSDNFQFEIKMFSQNTSAYLGYRSVNSGTATGDMRWFFNYSDGRVAIRYGDGTENSTLSFNTQTTHKFYFNGSSLYVDDVNYLTTTKKYATPVYNSFYLFSVNTSGYYSTDIVSFVGRIYYAKIWDNNVLVRDFIPCIDPLGVACMYDLVSKKPYYNAGTGTFTAGRQVIPVKYLESTGTQYIDTGYVPKPTSSYKCGFELTSIATTSGAWFCVFGSVESNNAVFTELFLPRASGGGNVNQVLVGNHNSTYIRKDYAWAINTSYDFEMTTTDVSINGVSQGSITVDSSVTCSHSIYLFARHEYNDAIRYNVSAKIYSFKILEGNTPVCDFIPCKDENNVGFMFDTLSGTVYLNAGTGSFSVGENKYASKLRLIKEAVQLPDDYKRVEYLQSDGNQYIDTEYTINTATDEVLFNFQMISTTNYQWLMGEHDNGARFGVGVGDGTNKRNIAYGATTYKVNDTEIYNSIHYFKANSNGV